MLKHHVSQLRVIPTCYIDIRCVTADWTDVNHPISEFNEGPTINYAMCTVRIQYLTIDCNIPFDWNIHVCDVM